MKLVVALSGAVGSGKSTVAKAILSQVKGQRLSTRELIIARTLVDSERLALQAAGDQLDAVTDFGWISEAIDAMDGETGDEVLVIDALRRTQQLDRLRSRFPGRFRHIHLTVDAEVLKARHAVRQHDVVEPSDYTAVTANATEANVGDLAKNADIVFDPSRLDDVSIAAVVLAGLGLMRRVVRPLVDVVVGGQYGSEGKGNICSYLAEDYAVLMRVGGPNAGHKVKDPDFDFVHLPSGALHNPAARLLIGPGATLSLGKVLEEIERIGVLPSRLSIDPQAIVIDPNDVAIEEGSLEVIGSTKKGVGVATARKILNRGNEPVLGVPVRLARDEPKLAAFVRPTWIELETAYAAKERVMLEGTQGTDLSIHHGMWPHVTSRETTASGCMADAGVPHDRVDKVIMVVRTYPIRVGGKSGYMGREIGAEVIAARSGLDEAEIRATEVGTISGKPRRIAEFDLGQVRRAAALNGATEIALTFADYLSKANRDAATIDELGGETRSLIRQIEEVTGIPVTLISSGGHRNDMIEKAEK